VLFGDFGPSRLSDYDNGYDFNAMLAYLRTQLRVPLLQGLPFGHIRDKVSLPVGALTRLVADEQGFTLSFTNNATLPV